MIKALQAEFDLCITGTTPARADDAHGRDYSTTAPLQRWIAPLDHVDYGRLVEVSAPGTATGDDVRTPNLRGREAPPLPNPDTLALQIVYERTVEAAFQLALHRNADFWSWRYLRSAAYKYQFFGSVVDLGIVVVRVECAVCPNSPQLDGVKVLRILECLPARPQTWTGQPDEGHVSLLRGVLAWAAKKRCALADFYHTSDRLGHVLERAGFTRVGPAAPPAIRAVPHRFQPMTAATEPMQCTWRLTGPAATGSRLEPRDVYFVKSDGSMDRPQVWPIPSSRA